MGGWWRAQGRLYGGLGGESLVEIERRGGRVDGGLGRLMEDWMEDWMDGDLDGGGSMDGGMDSPSRNRTELQEERQRAVRTETESRPI